MYINIINAQNSPYNGKNYCGSYAEYLIRHYQKSAIDTM